MNRRCARVVVAILLLVVTILNEWLWWESYKATINWSKRHELFPLPFYIAWLPHWFIVDMCILLITVCTTALTIMVVLDELRRT